MSKVASHPWALPGFSILAAAIFITVHITSGQWRETPNISNGEGFDKTLDTGREETGGGLTTDEGVRPFTYVPTSSPIEDDTNQIFVPVPTTIVLGHNIPQPGSKPSNTNGGDDNDIPTLKWDIPLGEPTPDPALLYDPATPPLLLNKGERGEGKHGSAPPGYGEGDGSPSNLKWNIPYGQPTPDPAMLIDPATPPSMKDYGDTPVHIRWDIPLGEPTPDPALLNPSNGIPVNLKWDIPLGEPTPDPALLNPSNGIPVLLKWNIPLGEPTPDPALLTPNQGSPINLKWNIPLGEPTPDPALLTPNLGSPINLKWNIPLGEPTPDPALLTPNLGSPINLKWNIPLGEPTPDPALLTPNLGKPVLLKWNIPLGEPTPDPALLTPNLGSPINLKWNIPLGEPTPDPALLTPNLGKPVLLKWNIPLGEPTPDPAQLESNIGNPIVLKWIAPYPRPLEFGTFSPSVPTSPMMPARNTLNPTTKSKGTTTSEPIIKPSSFPQMKPTIIITTNKPNVITALPTIMPTTDKPIFFPSVTTKLPQSLPSMLPTNQPQFPPRITSLPTLQPTPSFPLPTPFPSLSPVPLPTPPPVMLPLPTILPASPPVPPPTPPPLIPPAPITPPTLLPVLPPASSPVPPPPVPPPPTNTVVPPPPVPPSSPPPPPSPPTPQIPGTPTPPIPNNARTPGGGSSTSTVWTPGGGDPSWTSGGTPPVIPPTANVSLPVPHNQKFLKDCNPLICSLNEAADFHSMSNEDEAIYEIFYTNPIKCCRVVVEIGAGDGDRYSFSKFFEEGLKWKPLLIEANPDVFQQLRSNRPNATKVNGAFCESGNLLYRNDAFSSLGGSVEVSSEIHTPLQAGSDTKEIPCLSMDVIFEEHGITKVDVMVVRLQGDALAFIRAMDWTVRVDIWVILMHGASKKDRDELVRKVLKGNEYVQAEWDIKRWCNENGQCLNNEVFLRKGFNPLPCDFYNKLTTTKITPARQLRGKI